MSPMGQKSAILQTKPRSEPLTDAEIIACETKQWY